MPETKTTKADQSQKTDMTLDELIESCTNLSMRKLLPFFAIKKNYWYDKRRKPLEFTVEDIEKIHKSLVQLAQMSEKDIDVSIYRILDCIRYQAKLAAQQPSEKE